MPGPYDKISGSGAQGTGAKTTAVTKEDRAAALNQRPCCIWLTGLSGAGKSTLATLLEQRLFALSCHAYVLDGDIVRAGLSRDLSFSQSDRSENIRRAAEVARLMVDAGLVTIVSFISPFRAERELARTLFSPSEFIEIYIDTPLDVCEARDAKGLYRRARAGELADFTGISSPYEPPLEPEIRLAGGRDPPDALIETILAELERRGLIANTRS